MKTSVEVDCRLRSNRVRTRDKPSPDSELPSPDSAPDTISAPPNLNPLICHLGKSVLKQIFSITSIIVGVINNVYFMIGEIMSIFIIECFCISEITRQSGFTAGVCYQTTFISSSSRNQVRHNKSQIT